MRRILILVHEDGALDDSNYFLREIAAIWANEYGHKVIVQRGPGEIIDADVAVLHVDLTITPENYMHYLSQYPILINGAVTDISKRHVSSSVIRNRREYSGPVIVKTNSNFGGFREERLMRKHASRWQSLLHRIRKKLHWSMRTELPMESYPIFSSADQVPWMVWHNPDLVVERLRCELSGEWYCLRTWVFLGDRETHSLSYSAYPVIKQANIVRREALGDVPNELRQIRTRLGFDFGKFDYAIVDGEVVLYDANRTPTLGNFPREQFLPRIRLLAEGLESLILRGKEHGIATSAAR